MLNSTLNISLLSRAWKIPTISAIIVYVVILASLIHNRLNAFDASCSEIKKSNWTWFVNFFECSVFLAAVAIQFSKLILRNVDHSDIGVTATTCLVSSIAGTSSLINLVGGLLGNCEDFFGVKMPEVYWAEWISCVPLLYYIVLTTDSKENLSQKEIALLLLNITQFLSGLFLQLFKSTYSASVLLLLISFMADTISSILFFSSLNISDYFSRNRNRTQCETGQNNEQQKCLRNSQVYLGIFLLIFCKLFSLVYLLAFFKVISHDTTFVMFIILNVSTKLIFVSIINNTHMNLHREIIRLRLLAETAALHAETAANEARRLFVRYIMHEVRVPLNSITMGIGYLEQCPNLDEDAQEALLMMEGATGFMKQTLNDVLNMQRIEEGKLELDYAPFYIEKAMQRVKSSVQGILKEKEINLIIDIESNVPKKVMGDGFRIEHVVVNLVSNALKFSPNYSDVSLTIRCHSSLTKALDVSAEVLSHRSRMSGRKISNGMIPITFSVTDYGPGMSSEDMAKLFIPFSQIRPQEAQQGGGSGVGLVICKQIVSLHGGSISCQSVIGEGSTFAFTIPFIICQEEEVNLTEKRFSLKSVRRFSFISDNKYNQDNTTTTSTNVNPNTQRLPRLSGYTHSTRATALTLVSPKDETNVTNSFVPLHNSNMIWHHHHDNNVNNMNVDYSSPSHTPSSTSQLQRGMLLRHVLLVDDVTSNRKLLAMLLRRFLIDSTMASHGLEGVDAVKSGFQEFDMIFMDNMMPVMNGIEATKLIRCNGYNQLIIGLTGNAMEDDVEEFIRAGADAVILKPVTVSQLKQIIDYIKDYGNIHQPHRQITFFDDHVDIIDFHEGKL